MSIANNEDEMAEQIRGKETESKRLCPEINKNKKNTRLSWGLML